MVFLPMLIFESAFNLDWFTFKRVLAPALVLAVPGLLLSIGLTGAVIHNIILPDFTWIESMLLATLYALAAFIQIFYCHIASC